MIGMVPRLQLIGALIWRSGAERSATEGEWFRWHVS